MNFKKILSLALLVSSTAFAGECCEKTNFYILTESGWSWPTCPKFCIGYDGDFGKDATEQDSILFSSKPHYSYVISAEVGVEFNNWLSLGSSFNIRPLYEYCQSADAVGTDQARTIYFTLSNMSFMYVAAINRGVDPCWSWECGCFRLAPFVAGGVGLAYTTFGHFVAISDDAFGGLVVNKVLQEQVATTTSSFAWQVQVGLEASYAERLSFGVSYRFFNAGTWSTATDRCCINYWSNYEGAAQYPDLAHATLNPVSGKLRANELVFNLMINF